jgi:hypothetical protein
MVLERPLAGGGGLVVRRGVTRRRRKFPWPLLSPGGDGKALVHPSNPAGHDLGIHNQVVAVLNPPLEQRHILEQATASLFVVE